MKYTGILTKFSSIGAAYISREEGDVEAPSIKELEKKAIKRKEENKFLHIFEKMKGADAYKFICSEII
jgi:hypothetical protein